MHILKPRAASHEKIQKVSDHRKAPAFNTQGELSVQCPYCHKVNIFPESESLEIITCEYCGETVEIDESVE